jgi:DNA repair exonuclease SbcCD ATPase subunit
LNEVEDNFQSIKSAENYLQVQSSSAGDMTPSTRERIQNDIQLITKTLKTNKDKITELEKKLNNSAFHSKQLQNTLENLRNQLSEKTMALVNLQEELATRDQKIEALSTEVAGLSVDVQNLRAETNAQQETIKKQDTELNTVYYCFGTTKELKAQKILVDGELGTNFNRDYFIKIKDARSLEEIPVYAKKAKLISKHPEGSYEETKDASGNIVYKITDSKNFWSLTKYLVIRVNV